MDTVTLSVPLPGKLYELAQEQAQEHGESVESLLQELLIEYLEEIEDVQEAREVLARVESGEVKPIPWEEAEAQLDEWERKGELPD